MFIRRLAWSVGLSVVFWSLPALASFPVPKSQSLDQLKTELTKLLREANTPGMGLALVTKESTLFIGGFGLANVARKTPATRDTLFRIGSISKAFVAMAALKLRREAKLDFNATIASLAPEIEFKNPWEATHPVQFVHLLEHTTGFDDIHLVEYANQDPRPNNLHQALTYHPDSRVSRWRPGTRAAYCNAGPAIAAFIIQKITGEVFEDYVEREFFTPIGMKTATFFKPVAANAPPLAELYAADGVTPYEYWHISMRPAGSINASADDMAAYVRFHLNRGRLRETVVLQEDEVLRMERPVSSSGARAGLLTGYGLYNVTSFDEEGRLWHGHGGGVQGGSSEMSYQPEAGVGYAFMINANGSEKMKEMSRMIRAFLTQAAPKPARPLEHPIPNALQARYAGFYVPISPRLAAAEPVERALGVARLSFNDGSVQFGRLLGRKNNYVGVSSTLLRKKEHSAASLVLLDPAAEGAPALVEGMRTLERKPALWALSPLVAFMVAAAAVVSNLLIWPIWLVLAALKKADLRKHLALRVAPLVSVLATLWFVVSIVAMLSDGRIFQHYGVVGARSVALAASGVAALLATLGGLIWIIWSRSERAPRVLRGYAFVSLLALSAPLLYMTATGALPVVLWR